MIRAIIEFIVLMIIDDEFFKSVFIAAMEWPGDD